jgi:hypothetical protein
VCLLEAQQQTHFSLLTCAVAGCVHHQAMTYCIHFVKAKNFTDHNKGVCITVPLPFTLKSILMQKKNYENSNISPCKKYNLQKIL